MTPQPNHRRRATCRRHPKQPITGFCATCLRERLAGIDPDTHQQLPSAAAILRRSKSCRTAAAFATAEPRRNSCDVRPHNTTLSDLFTRGQNGDKLTEGKTDISHGDGFEGELRPIREFIDLELETKKANGVASSFINKLRKWGKKNRKIKMPVTRPVEFREGLSELRRRSCDIDINPGRISLDGGRCSFDEPRASWDGVLIGRTCSKFSPMVSVAEDVKNPGGSDQTRDYYGETRPVSNRRIGLVEVDELKSVSNAKVSPETDGLFHGAKLLITEKDLKESNWYSLKEYRAESVKDGTMTDGLVTQKGLNLNVKKSYKWGKVLNFWNLVQKKSEGKCNNQEKRVDGTTVAEGLEEKVKVANGGGNPDVSQKLIRSYTVSSRNSCSLAKFSDGVSSIESNSNAVKRKDDLVLQRNGSVKASPSNLDNSLLHFYLTSPRSSRRNSCGNR